MATDGPLPPGVKALGATALGATTVPSAGGTGWAGVNLRRRRRWYTLGRWRSRRHRGALHRAVDVIVESHPVIRRDALRDQVGVERVGPGGVLAHGQRLVVAVALADLHGGRTLAGLAHAGVVAGAAHGDRRILRQFAVQAVGGVDIGQVRRRTPRRRRQEAHRAGRRITDGQGEVALGETGGVVAREADRLHRADVGRQQHQQLLERRVVGHGDPADRGEVGQQDRQRRLHRGEQLGGLVEGARDRSAALRGSAGRWCSVDR